MSGRTVVQVGVGLLLAVILVSMARGYRACAEDGGRYVRGLFWMECVERRE